MSCQRTPIMVAAALDQVTAPDGLPPLTAQAPLPMVLVEQISESGSWWTAYFAEREGDAWHAFLVSGDGEDLVRQASAYLEGGGHAFRHGFILAPTNKVTTLLRLESGKAWP